MTEGACDEGTAVERTVAAWGVGVEVVFEEVEEELDAELDESVSSGFDRSCSIKSKVSFRPF